ncbi:MAG: hypothetical protein M3Y82_11720 [Verrucomicrobiota bacterium]|nr:hypothetical protein [Verrucomicrobiota bacterium]
MKKLFRSIAIVAVVSTMALAQSAFAGQCCKKAADQAKAGKACEKCIGEHKCCKDAIADVTKNGKAKECAKCAAAKKEDKKS